MNTWTLQEILALRRDAYRFGQLDGFKAGYARGFDAGTAHAAASDEQFAEHVAAALAVRLHLDERVRDVIGSTLHWQQTKNHLHEVKEAA
ncbi:hypothetical protein [Brevibacterium samyangense]|uniref:Uncharacterized protein n=1 Tax=Brevibacterium samyangense TaxID=366888 RepID=A0ABN2TNA6_9MICO